MKESAAIEDEISWKNAHRSVAVSLHIVAVSPWKIAHVSVAPDRCSTHTCTVELRTRVPAAGTASVKARTFVHPTIWRPPFRHGVATPLATKAPTFSSRPNPAPGAAGRGAIGIGAGGGPYIGPGAGCPYCEGSMGCEGCMRRHPGDVEKYLPG